MLLWFSIVVHLVFFFSIIDIHFRGIYSNYIPSIKCTHNLGRLSRRVVLILDDYSSANNFFSNVTKLNNSFARYIMENEGSWGVSHATKATVSKPGFKAIVTGTRYDASELWSHFKLKPPNLDTILHKSEIVYYFAMGDERIWEPYKKNYTKQEQTSLTRDNFLNNLKRSNVTSKLIGKTAIILIDLKKVKKWPLAKNLSRIEAIDEVLKLTNKVILEMFKDNLTTFIYTSTRGENFQQDLPFICWGTGITNMNSIAANKLVNKSILSKNPSNWKLLKLNHIEINQKDIALLTSILLGVDIPSQANGIVPIDILSASSEFKAKALSCNVQQLKNLYDFESKEIKTGRITIIPLSPKNETNNTLIAHLESLITSKNFSGSIKLSKKFIKTYFSGLEFYRDYFKCSLNTVVISTYAVWGILLLQRILVAVDTREPKQSTDQEDMDSLQQHNSISSVWSKITLKRTICNISYTFLGIVWDSIAIFKACLITVFVYVQNWPIHFLVYLLLFDVIWWRVCKGFPVFLAIYRDFTTYLRVCRAILLSVLFVFIIILIIIDVPFLVLGIILITMFPYIAIKAKHRPIYLQIVWLVSSTGMALVALLLNQEKVIQIVKLSVFGWIILASMYLYYNKRNLRDSVWTFVMIFSMVTVAHSPILNGTRISYSYRILYCILLFSCPFFPILSSQKGILRLFHICFSFAVPELILSTFQEGMGLLFLSVHLLVWFCMELMLFGYPLREIIIGNQHLTTQFTDQDIRRSFLLLFYTWVSYFITGNVDYPQSINPYKTGYFYMLMALYKFTIPFIILSSVFLMMYQSLHGKIRTTIESFLLLNNLVGLYFFLSLDTTTNDYIYIGRTLKRHFLSQIISIVIVSIYPLSKLLITFSLPSNEKMSASIEKLLTGFKAKYKTKPIQNVYQTEY